MADIVNRDFQIEVIRDLGNSNFYDKTDITVRVRGDKLEILDTTRNNLVLEQFTVVQIPSVSGNTIIEKAATVRTFIDQGTQTGTDEFAIHDNISSEISAIVAKVDPVGADLLLIEDSEDSNAKKSITIADLPTGLLWFPPPINVGDGSTSGVSLFRAGAGGIQYAFDGGSDDEWSVNIPLNWNGMTYDGSDLKIRIKGQLSANGGGTDDIQWEIQYAFMDAGDDSDGAGTTFTDSIDVSSRVTGQVYDDLLPTALTGVASKTFLQLSIMRDSQGGGSDSYGGSIWVTTIELEKV